MAKKQNIEETETTRGQSRQSRKEILRTRKQEEQQRVIRIAALVVGLIIVLVLGIAIVNEFILTPNKSVATVNGQGIMLSDWQERVTYERAQRILALEGQLEAFGGDVGLVQQFSSQSIIELINENAEGLGEAVLDRLIVEEIIRQEAEKRGIVPSDEEIQDRIEETYNYFGGDSPPPAPDPTETIAPTPSLTPIPIDGQAETEDAAVDTPVVEATVGNTLPTATPVSEEAFQQALNDTIAQFDDLGVGEKSYRSVIENALITEQLVDALSAEQNLPNEDMHASMFILAYSDEAEANEALAEINAGDYLTVWNTVRSRPTSDAETENPPTGSASELFWRTRDSIANGISEELADNVFGLPLNTPSDLLTVTGSDGEPLYVIIMVSGRELRELAADEYDSRKQQLLAVLIEDERSEGVEISELWRSRVPTSPVLDPKFRQAPTPVPGSEDDETGGTGIEDDNSTP